MRAIDIFFASVLTISLAGAITSKGLDLRAQPLALTSVQAQFHRQTPPWMEQSIVALGMARLNLDECRAIAADRVSKDEMCVKCLTAFMVLCDRTDVIIVDCEEALAKVMKGDLDIDIQYLDTMITGCAAVSVALNGLAKEW